MKTPKTFIKVVLCLAGPAVGVILGGGAAVLFTDITWSQFMSKLSNVMGISLVLLLVEAFIGMALASVIGIVIHEAGHLLFGLLTGYGFVSFRVFSLTLVKTNGRIRLKRFSLGGTGGQCLMRPPQRPIEQIDTRWYNAGGVLMNLLCMVACLALFMWSSASNKGNRLPQWLEITLLMGVIVNAIYALMNGIPMRLSGIGNDGYNLLHLETRPIDKLILYRMLEANARVQTGTLPKDLPTYWFESCEQPDWADGLVANWQMMKVAHLENRHEWEAAYALLADAMAHRGQLMNLFLKELTAEMVFVCLAIGRTDEAQSYWTGDIEAYVRQFAPTQSSKQRVLYAVHLRLKPDLDQAQQLLSHLQASTDHFLLQGEVQMDLALMEWLRTSI